MKEYRVYLQLEAYGQILGDIDILVDAYDEEEAEKNAIDNLLSNISVYAIQIETDEKEGV